MQIPDSVYMVTWRLRRDQAPLTPEERELVSAAVRHFDGERYLAGAWVVMPDHVHVVVLPLEPHTLSQILHSWKSYTANRLQRASARQGCVWQDESHDRLIRHHAEYLQKMRYVLENPMRRWPDQEEYAHAGVGMLES